MGCPRGLWCGAVLALICLVGGGSSWTEEGDAAEPKDPKAAKEADVAKEALKDQQKRADRKAAMQKMRDLMAKKKAGEELTQDEKAWLEDNAKFAEKAERKEGKEAAKEGGKDGKEAPREKGPDHAGPPKGPPMMPVGGEDKFPIPPELNAIDAATVELARVHAEKGRTDEAIACLKGVIEKSPDPLGKSVAAFGLARILQERGDMEGAKANLRLVTTGRLAETACKQIIAPLVKEGKHAEAMDEVLSFARSAATPLDKVRALRGYVQVARDSGKEDLLVKALKDVPGLITYDEAKKAEELAAKEPRVGPAGMAPKMGPPWAKGQEANPQQAFRELVEALPEDMREKVRDIGTLPPEERAEAIRQLHENWAKRIGEAEKAGDVDRARKMRDGMERMEKFRRERQGMKGKHEGRAPDPERLKGEIKELEDQGRFEEAKKLRRDLESAKKQAGDEKGDF